MFTLRFVPKYLKRNEDDGGTPLDFLGGPGDCGPVGYKF